MTTMTVDVNAALEQWGQHLDVLPGRVLLARNVTGGNYITPAVHILALDTIELVRRPHARKGTAKRPPPATALVKPPKVLRTMVGLDTPESVIVTEACFCATRSNVRVLRFNVWQARKKQDLLPIPTCSTCLNICYRITGIPVEQIRGEKLTMERDPLGGGSR